MVKREVDFSELRTVVQKLRGTKAWGSRAGSGTGSIFTLQFGEPLANKPEWGEYSIMVTCAWRVTKGVDIVCTWHEDSDGVLASGLAFLHSSEVQTVTLSDWGDLHLELSDRASLHIFADLPEEMETNWFISTGRTRFYSWSTNFTVMLEEH